MGQNDRERVREKKEGMERKQKRKKKGESVSYGTSTDEPLHTNVSSKYILLTI